MQRNPNVGPSTLDEIARKTSPPPDSDDPEILSSANGQLSGAMRM